MNVHTRQISRRGTRKLLSEIKASECTGTVCISAETLASRDYSHLLPEPGPERSRVLDVLSSTGKSETGVAIFMGPDSTIAVQPPFPMSSDVAAPEFLPDPITEVLDSSEQVVGVVLLRLGRYAIGLLRGDDLLATKTDSRYVKNRHRKGGSSQRRFARSRERLIRELYDKTCQMTRTIFEPHLNDIDYLMLGGEKTTLNGFVKRCRLMQDLKSKTLSRILPVDRPNQRSLESIAHEVWKSRVTILPGQPVSGDS